MSDLFNMSDSTMDFLEKKSSTTDGIYRPSLKGAKDAKKGYRSVIRFLPNLQKNGELGPSSLTKLVHYANLPDYPELRGYYDSQKSFGKSEPCALYDTYWELNNSNNVVLKAKAELIKYNTKFFSYVQVIEDENQPEMEGKILVFPYGKKIKDKIAQEWSGDITGEKCNVFDLANGKDFVLIIREVGGHTNYDNSTFKPEISAIKIGGKEVPVVEDTNGKRSINAKFQEGVRSLLLKREGEIENFTAKRWTNEEENKVNRIVQFVKGNPITDANNSISKTAKDDYTKSEVTTSSDVDPDDFFNSL